MDRRGGLPRRPARAAPGCRTRAAPRRPPEGLSGPALGRGRAKREAERSSAAGARAQRAEGAGWVEGAGRAEGAGPEQGAASAAASAPPPPPPGGLSAP